MNYEKGIDQIDSTWSAFFKTQTTCEYWSQLQAFLGAQKQIGKVIFPKEADCFNAFKLTPLDSIKVVILGQDPYHGEGQANGLAFSVPLGVKIPPSLGNIYKELKSDLNYPAPAHGYLESWAQQGVLLLNTVLTVEAGKANSHKGKGWEIFTDNVLKQLNDSSHGIAFLLWGAPAKKKGQVINRQKHHVICTSHPSPLSSYRGFLGSKPFSQVNQWLTEQGKKPIDWSLGC